MGVKKLVGHLGNKLNCYWVCASYVLMHLLLRNPKTVGWYKNSNDAFSWLRMRPNKKIIIISEEHKNYKHKELNSNKWE